MFLAVLLFAVTMAMWQSASNTAAYERELRVASPETEDGEGAVHANRVPSLLVGTLAVVLFASGIALLSLGAITDEQREALRLRRPGHPDGDL
jgi:hypothetical protein